MSRILSTRALLSSMFYTRRLRAAVVDVPGAVLIATVGARGRVFFHRHVTVGGRIRRLRGVWLRLPDHPHGPDVLPVKSSGEPIRLKATKRMLDQDGYPRCSRSADW